MAEESPRPGTEEDAEEEGEEAAEAPLRKVLVEKGDEDATPDSPPPPPPGEDDQASSPAAPSKAPGPPLKQDSPARQPRVPTFQSGMYPTASPAFYSAPPAESAFIPQTLAYSSPAVSGVNHFANDGSFLELFKKKMEATSSGVKEESKEPEEEKKPDPDKRKPVSFVGKRRGGAKLALKTGIVVKKPKTEEEEILTHKGGAWAQYMAEVKKYKAHQCSDDDKTRPLVK